MSAQDFLFDLHCHTREKSYDGEIAAVDLARTLAERGFAGAVYTDHAHTWSAAELSVVRHEANLPDDFILLAAQEVRTEIDGVTGGDLLVYGPAEDIPDGTSAHEVFRLVDACGGFCIAPHPTVPRIGFGPHIDQYPVLAAEVWNGRHGERANAAAMMLASSNGLAQVGGSDAHVTDDIGGGGTLFPRRPRSIAEIKELLRHNMCAPWRPETRPAAWFKKLGLRQ